MLHSGEADNWLTEMLRGQILAYSLLISSEISAKLFDFCVPTLPYGAVKRIDLTLVSS